MFAKIEPYLRWSYVFSFSFSPLFYVKGVHYWRSTITVNFSPQDSSVESVWRALRARQRNISFPANLHVSSASAIFTWLVITCPIIAKTGVTPFVMSIARISRSSRCYSNTPLIRWLSSLDGAAKVSVTNGRKNLQLVRPGSKEKCFHSLWLRHSCQCSECTYTSGQRTVHWSELPKDLKIKSAKLSG